jgi:hypothetical protein
VLALPPATDDLFVQNKYAVNSILGTVNGGSDSKTLEKSLMTSVLSGTPVTSQTETLTGYTGSANSTHAIVAPLVIFAWYISAQSLNGANIALNAVYTSWKLIFDVEFYERLPNY